MSQHSNILTKLHEEVHPRLKEIRNLLNALDLERQQPKQKEKHARKKTTKENIIDHAMPNSGSGGKAGKPYIIVQVGDIDNRYKTKKSNHWQHSGAAATMIDLHGYTKNDEFNTF